jgi:hypothetical protein
MAPRAQATKNKNKQGDYIKPKPLHSKEIIGVKRQPLEWEKTFVNLMRN